MAPLSTASAESIRIFRVFICNLLIHHRYRPSLVVAPFPGDFSTRAHRAPARLVCDVRPSRRPAFRMRAFESWRTCFDLPHRFAIVDLLATVRALIILQVRNRVFFTLCAARPVAANLFDLTASTGRASCDLKHSHILHRSL